MTIKSLAFRDAPGTTDELDQLKSDVADMFAYHPWDEQQVASSTLIRDALAAAYESIIRHAPPSPLRTRALNNVVDARMLANAAITFKGEQ